MDSDPTRTGAAVSGFWHWLAAQMFSAAPQAMAPVAFSLATVNLSSEIGVGAAMMAAMTLGQVVFAVPVSAFGRRFGLVPYLRAILLCRGVAFVALTVTLVLGGGVALLITLAAACGVVNGAIHGSFRALLNSLVRPDRLPRSLAIGATANELVFVVGPVLAAALGAVALPLPVALMIICVLVPVALLPRVAAGPAPSPGSPKLAAISPALSVWLLCALSGSAAVGAVETGAVTLALHFGLAATWAVLFTVALCIASVAGGLVVTWANRIPRHRTVLVLLAAMAAGAITIGLATEVWVAVVGAVLVGLCLAPLGTFYSLAAEKLLPLARRAEGFSLLRTAQGVGVIVSALGLTFLPPSVVYRIAGLLLVISLIVVATTRRYLNSQNGPVA